MIRVNARLFKIASLFQSTDETRYYLNGVCVEPHPDGALMAATDGHRLIVILDRSGACERTAIIGLPTLMRRALVAYVDEVERDDDDEVIDRTRVCCEDRTLTVDGDGYAEIAGHLRACEKCVIDGKFPDWRRIVPKRDVSAPVTSLPVFDGNYIAAFAEAANLFGDTDHQIIHIAPVDAEAPALVLFSGFRDAFAVLMPVRSAIAHEELRVPAWAGIPDQAQKEPVVADTSAAA
jgi:DNA polymerase III beta subunit, central domain